jgi:hypothetical protein
MAVVRGENESLLLNMYRDVRKGQKDSKRRIKRKRERLRTGGGRERRDNGKEGGGCGR